MSYTWQGIKKINFEEVKRICQRGIEGFFLLYPDETEANANGSSWEDIENHYNKGGEFGIELMKKKFVFMEEWEDTFPLNNDENEVQKIEIMLLVNEDDITIISTEMQKAYNNWMCDECENSILIDTEKTSEDLCQICIGDYILMWLDKLNIEYKEVA